MEWTAIPKDRERKEPLFGRGFRGGVLEGESCGWERGGKMMQRGGFWWSRLGLDKYYYKCIVFVMLIADDQQKQGDL